MNNRNPLTLNRMQVGKVLKRDTIGTLVNGNLYDIDLTDTDCSVQLAFDCSFDVLKAPNAGQLSMYRKSMLLRSGGTDPIRYGLESILSAALVAASYTAGISSGLSMLIPEGLESMGIVNALSNGGGIDVINFTYCIRIVDYPTSDGR